MDALISSSITSVSSTINNKDDKPNAIYIHVPDNVLECIGHIKYQLGPDTTTKKAICQAVLTYDKLLQITTFMQQSATIK